MEQRRLILYIALMAILFLLWQAWQTDYGISSHTQKSTELSGSPDAPPASAQQVNTNIPVTKSTGIPGEQNAPAGQIVQVETDVVRAKINTQGGNLIELSLLKYSTALNTSNDPVKLLMIRPSNFI